jgi:hypothetical protein
MASANSTTDHDFIRRWVEQRGGHPAHVRRTAQGDDAGVLRIDFPGYSGGDTLEEIPWDEWFQKFDESNLAFLYDDGGVRFNKLVSRQNTTREDVRDPQSERSRR